MKFLISALAICLPLTARAQQSLSTQEAVARFIGEALDSAKLPATQILNGDGTQAGFCSLIQRAFDVEAMGRAVVPESAWDQATPEQRKDYLRAAGSHLANIAAIAFMQLGGKTPVIQYQDAGLVDNLPAVQVTVAEMDLKQIVLVHRMPDSTFRVYDVQAGGVSMLKNKRADFRRAAQKGLPVLTRTLNEISTTRLRGVCAQEPSILPPTDAALEPAAPFTRRVGSVESLPDGLLLIRRGENAVPIDR